MVAFSPVHPVTTSADLPPEMPPGGVTAECFLPGFGGGQLYREPDLRMGEGITGLGHRV
jgi:hypothetical protein